MGHTRVNLRDGNTMSCTALTPTLKCYQYHVTKPLVRPLCIKRIDVDPFAFLHNFSEDGF